VNARILSGLHVLVVDDNPSNLGYARELMATLGVMSTVAAGGAEAVSLTRKHRFDLILMDIQMPVLDGFAATKQIRRIEAERSHPRTPVLAYTSHTIEKRLLRDCGLDGVLDKPCAADVLRACLLRWCASPRVVPPTAPDERLERR
jgi:CheY-like chemotaxis protein